MINALLGPGLVDGTEWDGLDTSTRRSGLASSLLATNPYAGAAGFIAGLSQETLAKPDPVGVAQLFTASGVAALDLPMTFRDTFTPAWSATFVDVPTREDVRVRITLIDKDLASDDAIGTVELTRSDLLYALHEGVVTPIRVADQSQSQILFIGISVTAQ